MIHSGESAKG